MVKSQGETAVARAPHISGSAALSVARSDQSSACSALAVLARPCGDPRLSRTVNPYRLIRRLFRRGDCPSLIRLLSRREHLLLDEGVESSIEAAPAAAEITPFDEV